MDRVSRPGASEVRVSRRGVRGTGRAGESSSEPTRIMLAESGIPRRGDNLPADLPHPPPPVLHPGPRPPLRAGRLGPPFPMALIEQEVSDQRWIDIPEPVLEVYRLWRPSPLYRAHRLERALGTPAKIFYKYEGGSPAGSHKPNTAVAQAHYNAAAGVRRVTTETGAGQWGSALAFACAQFGLDCEGWQGRSRYDHKAGRRGRERRVGRGPATPP